MGANPQPALSRDVVKRERFDPFEIARNANQGIGSFEAFLEQQTPLALEALEGGTQQAIDLTGTALGQATGQLDPFGGTEAFDERAALLGALGPRAQMRAINAIPTTEAGLFGENRQRQRLLRGAAARGEFGGGANIENLTNLGTTQAARRIQGRLDALSPLATTELGVASTLSGLGEAAARRQALIAAGLGQQQANIRLGNVAPITAANTTAAQISGLQGIGQANLQASLLGQAGQIGGLFLNRPAQAAPPQTVNNLVNFEQQTGIPLAQNFNAPNQFA